MYDESKYLQVRGTAAVATGVGGDKILSWAQERGTGSFEAVPARTRLIITDFMYFPQDSLTSRAIVNIAEVYSSGDQTILLQLFVNPHSDTLAHFHTGFVIAPGNRVKASTAGIGPGAHITVGMNGYLAPLL